MRNAPHTQFDRAPSLLDLDFADPPVLIADHGVEQFRPRDREGQEGEPVVGKPGEGVLRKPDRVGQTDQHRFGRVDERDGAKDRVAQPARLGLHRIGDRGLAGLAADLAAVILQDVEFPARDHKADLVGAALQHALDQVFADRARALGAALEAAADRQQFLREGQRLNARAVAGGGNDAPHGSSLQTVLAIVPAKAGIRRATARITEKRVPAFPPDQVRGLKARGTAVREQLDQLGGAALGGVFG